MKVATAIRLLRRADQQSDLMIEVVKGKTRTRYHARDVIIPGLVASSGGDKSKKVIITSE